MLRNPQETNPKLALLRNKTKSDLVTILTSNPKPPQQCSDHGHHSPRLVIQKTNSFCLNPNSLNPICGRTRFSWCSQLCGNNPFHPGFLCQSLQKYRAISLLSSVTNSINLIIVINRAIYDGLRIGSSSELQNARGELDWQFRSNSTSNAIDSLRNLVDVQIPGDSSINFHLQMKRGEATQPLVRSESTKL